MKFDLNDVLITPAIQSELISRSQAKCKYDLKNLKQSYSNQENKLISPVIVSPMDTVIDETNYLEFLNRGHMVCIPRGCKLEYKDVPKEYIDMTFFCYSLSDFKDLINTRFDFPQNVLLDLANGHISLVCDYIKSFKSYSSNKKIMVGNIANPETYKVLSEAGADYIRLSIGSGSACFVSGTKVKTNNGDKNIEDIRVGDLILTNDLSYQECILTHKKIHNDNLISINGNISTTDHEYYVVHKKDIDLIDDNNITKYAFYLKACEITKDYLLVSIDI